MSTGINDVAANFFLGALVYFGLVGLMSLIVSIEKSFSLKTGAVLRLILGLVGLGVFSLFPMLFWINAPQYDTTRGIAVFFGVLVTFGVLHFLGYRKFRQT